MNDLENFLLNKGDSKLLKYFYQHKKRIIETLELIGEQSEKKILDVGASPGFISFVLSKKNEIYTTDYYEAYLNLYPPMPNVKHFICAIEKEELPFPNDYFDIVVFTEVLEHIAISHPILVLNKIKRVLKPGGILFLTTPNVANIRNVLLLIINKNIYWELDTFYNERLDRHNREFTLAEVRRTAKEVGFIIESEGYIDDEHIGYIPSKKVITSKSFINKSAYILYLIIFYFPKLLIPSFRSTIFLKARK